MKNIILIVMLVISLAACTSKPAPKEKEAAPVMVEATLHVEGMHCTDCENSIAKGVHELAGIDSIQANHLDSTAFVRFDSNKTNLDEIKKAIEERGYTIASN